MTGLSFPSWPAVVAHAETMKSQSLGDLFVSEPKRADHFTLKTSGITLDYSKNFFNTDTRQLMIQLAEEAGIEDLRQQMFNGARINNTEDRSALHTLLRASQAPEGLEDEFEQVTETLDRIKDISSRVRNGEWRGSSGQTIKQILHLGIGGSYLGPKMVDEALATQRGQNGTDILCHYVANVDAHHLEQVLNALVPEETLVIIVSKSFTTLETKANAETTRQWLLSRISEHDLAAHLIAVSTNIEAATTFGLDETNILPMWDWVGGRYSVWSAVGIPIAIRYGFETFRALLDGAANMDQHFQTAPTENNMPWVMAFLSVMYQQCFGAETHAVLTYDHRLRFLPDHLQQVDMESNGKNRRLDGSIVSYQTGAIVWGGEGTNGQHAFHQLLHQGTRFVGIDFIATLKPDHKYERHHDELIASCLSQSQALMQGRSEAEIVDAANALQKKHKIMPGNRPSNTLFLEHLDAWHTGALIALYEHKVFCQAALWQINPFDQWGVELGKELGERILNALRGGNEPLDGSTRALLSRYTASKNR